MKQLDEEMNKKEVNISFLNEKGNVCDIIIFKDINGKALGIAIVDDHSFTLPDGTCYCDYYHQSEHENDYITRCILGEIVDKDKMIVRVTNQGQAKEFNAMENADYVKMANSKEELMVLIVNETFNKMNGPVNQEEKAKSIA